MPKARANGIELEYACFGDTDARPLLLLRGLGTQLIQWNPGLCNRIAAAGHRLVIFDNRDVGLSSHFSEAGVPGLAGVSRALGRGERPDVPYTLDDMADDVVGLMDALELESAHIAGISMGGMIVQQTAIRHPERVQSLTSIMSSTGEPGLPGPTPEANAALLEAPPTTRDAYREYSVRTQRCFTGPGFPFDAEACREMAGRVFDRAFDPGGVARQMAAVVASGSRREALGAVQVPALVIHGSADPLIPLAGGEATARALPDAHLEVIEGMGHDLPEGAWPRLVDAISEHTRTHARD